MLRAVTWTRNVNAALARVTGFRVVRATSPARTPGGAPKTRPPSARLPNHVDDEARSIIAAVRPRTMTSNDKLFALIVATRYLVDHAIDGAIVECGVWRGGSVGAVARTLVSRGVSDRELHLFDTFEGMPPPLDRDRRYDGCRAAQLLAAAPRDGKLWAEASVEDVRAGMDETGYPRGQVHLHRGLVEHTIPDDAPERIALLRLDTDWYESTRHELEHLYDRVPSGGVVLLDDYGYWQGAREAVDEFLERTGERILLAPMGSGRIAVKP
jgi:hypothetical protein